MSKSGSENRKKTSQFTVRMSPEDYARLMLNVERSGLSRNAYVSKTLLGATPPKSKRRPVPAGGPVRELKAELQRSGNNLNQIARSMNSGICPWNGTITHVLNTHRKVLDAILVTLGYRSVDHQG